MLKILFTFFIFISFSISVKATDFAKLDYKDSWTHHSVFGSPSWDNFIHDKKNPIVTGYKDAEWPVNGFLFQDIKSDCWYLYAGEYSRGYEFDLKKNPNNVMRCKAYRSCNKGKSWDTLGLVLPFEGVKMDNDTSEIGFAPDVSIVYYAGKYHMIFDYGSKNFTWGNTKESGIAYAVSDKPEGPFIIKKQPILENNQFLKNPILGKYNRSYAATLIKRKNDWMILFMLDSGAYSSWALAAITSPTLDGKWTEPVIINSVESNFYYPNLLEYFPAFSHNGYIYAPATSVSSNRNYQVIYRAPIQTAHQPNSWTLWKEGSIWHSLPVENEYEGIWGQTFHGFITKDNNFYVMFPSKTSKDIGTINLAYQKWTQLFKKQGFVLSGHTEPSISYVKYEFKKPIIKTIVKNSSDFSIIFDANSPLAPNKITANNGLHDLTSINQKRIEISGNVWKIISIDAHNKKNTVAEGTYKNSDSTTIEMYFQDNERVLKNKQSNSLARYIR